MFKVLKDNLFNIAGLIFLAVFSAFISVLMLKSSFSAIISYIRNENYTTRPTVPKLILHILIGIMTAFISLAILFGIIMLFVYGTGMPVKKMTN